MLNSIIIDKDFEDLPTIIKIFEQSFPANERTVTIEEILGNTSDFQNVIVYYDDDKLVGFTALFKCVDFTYLMFFAVNQDLRNHGYGSKILKALSERLRNNTIVLLVENPFVGEDSDNMKHRRKFFYERNGFTSTDFEIKGPVDEMNYLIMSNKILKNKKHIIDELWKMLKKALPDYKQHLTDNIDISNYY